MGDIAQSSLDFGYVTIRNYFETSHAKGPQDGAGANLKHKADMAVIKQQVYPDLKFYTHAYFSVGFLQCVIRVRVLCKGFA